MDNKTLISTLFLGIIIGAGGIKFSYDNGLQSSQDFSEYINGKIDGMDGRSYDFDSRIKRTNNKHWKHLIESRQFQNYTDNEKQSVRHDYFENIIKPILPKNGTDDANEKFYSYAKNIESSIKRYGFLYDFEIKRSSGQIESWRKIVDDRSFQNLTAKQQDHIRDEYFTSAIFPRVADYEKNKLKKEFNEYASKLETSVRENGFFKNPLPIPKTGYKLRHSSRKYVAPLKIITSGSDVHYFVKLSDRTSKEPILSVFIRGGDLISTDMPAGNYSMKYATGETWYGEKYLFGPDTTYSMAEEVFNFTVDSRGASGYTVELIQQVDGNLKTKDIDYSKW